ncbi:MAG: hypothetical protein ACP5O1_04405 [Phycisphaerae bacterium]
MSDVHHRARLPSGIELSNLQQEVTSHHYRANAHFPPDVIMFSGHFPGDPIVPGHCLLELVLDVLKSFGYRLEFKTIHRAKFHLPVRPGDVCSIDILLAPDAEDTLAVDGTLQRENQPVLEVSAVLAASQNG